MKLSKTIGTGLLALSVASSSLANENNDDGLSNADRFQNQYTELKERVANETAEAFCGYGVYFDNNTTPYNLGSLVSVQNNDIHGGLEVDINKNMWDLQILGPVEIKKYPDVRNAADMINSQFSEIKLMVDTKMKGLGCEDQIKSSE